MTGNVMKLKVFSFAFAMGIIWALGMLLLGWLGWWCQWGLDLIQVIASAYIGYGPTFLGGIIGAIWGFIDFFIFAALVAWVYNLCACGCPRKRQSDDAI